MKVVLVDDHPIYRQSFRVALSLLSSIEVIGEASSARAGARLIQTLKPDLGVIDFLLGDSDGISLARELRRLRTRTPVLLLGRFPHPVFLHDAVNAGVRGYALKTQPLGELIEAIEMVGSGKSYFSPELEPYLQAARTVDDAPLEQLSLREREVLCLLVEGRSSKDIARSLCISVRTADAHRLHINRKLGVRTPSELAVRLARYGLVSGPPASAKSSV